MRKIYLLKTIIQCRLLRRRISLKENSLKNKVLKFIDKHRKEIIKFLSEFIEYKSVTGYEEEVQRDFLKPFMEKMGLDHVELIALDQERKRPNVLAFLKGKGDGKKLLFNGHSDVVPVPDTQLKRWTVDPWKATVKDNVVYGRGACDMKGGITAMLWALNSILECDLELNGDIYIEIVVGEERMEHEIGTTGITKKLLANYPQPDFCINPEPTNCEIHTSTTGAFFFELEIPGKEAHVCQRNLTIFPQRYGLRVGSEVGVDAIEKAIPFLEFAYRYEREINLKWRDRILGSGGFPIPVDNQGVGIFVMFPVEIRGGTYLGSLPGETKITFVVSYPPWKTMDQVMDEIKSKIQAIAYTDEWLKNNPPKVKYPVFTKGWPPYTILPEHEGCKVLAKSYEEVTGKEPIFSGMKAVTDASFTGRLGIPSVIFGPGDLSMGVHGPDEFIPIEQLILCSKIYAIMIINWCGLDK